VCSLADLFVQVRKVLVDGKQPRESWDRWRLRGLLYQLANLINVFTMIIPVGPAPSSPFKILNPALRSED